MRRVRDLAFALLFAAGVEEDFVAEVRTEAVVLSFFGRGDEVDFRASLTGFGLGEVLSFKVDFVFASAEEVVFEVPFRLGLALLDAARRYNTTDTSRLKVRRTSHW